MSAHHGNAPIYLRSLTGGEGFTSLETDYAVFIDLTYEYPAANPLAYKRVDFAVRAGGQTVELSWEELLAKLGLDQ